jgi:signal transduction histidine kinase
VALVARVGSWFRRRHRSPWVLPEVDQASGAGGGALPFRISDLVVFWHRMRACFLVFLLVGVFPLTAGWESIRYRSLGDRRLIAFLLVAALAAGLLVDARGRIRRRDPRVLLSIFLDTTVIAVALSMLQLEEHALVVPFLYTALTAAILLPVGRAVWIWCYDVVLAVGVATLPFLGRVLGAPPAGAQKNAGVWITTGTFTILCVAETLALTGAVHRLALAHQSRIERQARRRDEFLAGVSHTLRTPLTSVVGFGQLIERDWGDRLPPEARGMLADLNQQADAMGAMVDNLVASAEDVAGELTLTMKPTDLVRAAADLVRSAAWLHPDKTIRLQGGPPVMAWADPTRIRQVIRNLLSNAILHGGDLIVLEARCGAEATLSVTDNGPGPVTCGGSLSLTPFEKCSPTAAAPSLGFGLPTSVRLAQLMGGNLTHQHTPGASTFTLSLPLSPPPGRAANPEASVETRHIPRFPQPEVLDPAPAPVLPGRRT